VVVVYVEAAVDVASESSSKDDRSKTEASSIDLEWEHEAGRIIVIYSNFIVIAWCSG